MTYNVPSDPQHEQRPFIVRWLMNLAPGYIKDEQTAHYVLLAFSILAIFIAIFVIPKSRNDLPNQDPHTTAGGGKAYYPRVKDQ